MLQIVLPAFDGAIRGRSRIVWWYDFPADDTIVLLFFGILDTYKLMDPLARDAKPIRHLLE